MRNDIWSRIWLSLGILCAVLLYTASANAQPTSMYHARRQALGSSICFSGLAAYTIGAGISAPNLFPLIGNAVNLRHRRGSHGWGITGVVMGTVGTVMQVISIGIEAGGGCGREAAIFTVIAIALVVDITSLSLGAVNIARARNYAKGRKFGAASPPTMPTPPKQSKAGILLQTGL